MIYALIALAAVLLAMVAYFFLGGPRLPPGTDEIIAEVSGRDLSHVVSGETGFAEGSGVRIWYEDRWPGGVVGEEVAGTVLLNFGIGGDGLFWPPAFMAALGEAGYRVIRYDQRGTGESDWIEDWRREDAYSLEDMAEDALSVLDACGVERAHLVGLSLGGFVVQEVALKTPERVVSMTLMSTSADPTDDSIPGPQVWSILRSLLPAVRMLRYRLLGGESNRVKEWVAQVVAVVGPEAVDVEELAELVLYDLRERRGRNLKAMRQHQVAVAITRPRSPLLGELDMPALVIHGTEDSMFPFKHAEKLMELLPNARLVVLEGVGHVFPYPDTPRVTEEIVAHLESV